MQSAYKSTAPRGCISGETAVFVCLDNISFVSEGREEAESWLGHLKGATAWAGAVLKGGKSESAKC